MLFVVDEEDSNVVSQGRLVTVVRRGRSYVNPQWAAKVLKVHRRNRAGLPIEITLVRLIETEGDPIQGTFTQKWTKKKFGGWSPVGDTSLEWSLTVGEASDYDDLDNY